MFLLILEWMSGLAEADRQQIDTILYDDMCLSRYGYSKVPLF